MYQSMAFLVGGDLDHRVEQGGHPKPAAETMGTGVRSDARPVIFFLSASHCSTFRAQA